jgi:hypothetical protein
LITLKNHNVILDADFTIKLHPKTLYELGKMCPENQLKFQEIYLKSNRSLFLAYTCLLFLPSTHYAFFGRWQLQFLFWLTVGGAFVWWMFDLYRLPKLVKDFNFQLQQKALMETKSVNVFKTTKPIHISKMAAAV